MRFLWDLMEKSETSFAAQCVSFISLSFILVSTVGMCLNTIPAIAEKEDNGKHFHFQNISVIWTPLGWPPGVGPLGITTKGWPPLRVGLLRVGF